MIQSRRYIPYSQQTIENDPSGKFYHVYLLVSESDPSRHYTGITKNLAARIKKHNRGDVPHTADYKPWRIENVVSFRSKEKAMEFEQYLKSRSGRAFAKKHF